MHGRVDDVLDAVQNHRTEGVGNIEESLDPQDLGTVPVEQGSQPHAKSGPIDWLGDAQRKRPDVGAVMTGAGVSSMLMIFVIVVVVVAMPRIALLGLSVGITQPPLNLGEFGVRIRQSLR